ncbi:pre-mRNA-splicing factor cwc22-like [Henckelia pumila]|uniref:pre-mRNA-splicing factor cwc22-like n=1 Tax=Henckelia pumila TaxID=405737 RepID=UPI003C6E66F5
MDSTVVSSSFSFSSSATIEYSSQKHRKMVEEKRIKWFSMKERITELVSNVNNISNVREIADEISKQDLFEGRGVFCQEIMKSQMDSPKLTNVYAALVAIINSNFPFVGLLLVKRLVLSLKEEYDRRGDPKTLRALSKFLAHLVNHFVVYALLANDVCLFLMGNPRSSDNVEVAVKFCIECGSTFQQVLPAKFGALIEEFHRVSEEWNIGWAPRFLISMLSKIQAHRFRDYDMIDEFINLVHIEDQQTHRVSMLHDLDPECGADDFRVYPSEYFSDIDHHGSEDDDDEEVSSQKPKGTIDGLTSL